MSHAFISYVREDSDTVDELSAELKAYGLQVWLDRSRLVPGDHWRDQIKQAIQGGAYFLACFSAASQRRERTYMNEEITVALGEVRLRPYAARWFIPVLIDDVELPDWAFRPGETLRDIHAVRLFPSKAEGIAALAKAMGLEDGKAAHENVLLELLQTPFLAEQQHALKQLYASATLSKRAQQVLAARVANTLPNERASAVTGLIGCAAGNLDLTKLAAAFFQDAGSDVRVATLEGIIKRARNPMPLALQGLRDPSPVVRRRAAEYLGGAVVGRRSKSAPALRELLVDPDRSLREFTAKSLLNLRKSFWSVVAGDHRDAFLAVVAETPELWEPFLDRLEAGRPKSPVLDTFILGMSFFQNRDVQARAIDLAPDERPEQIMGNIRRLMSDDVAVAVSAAGYLGRRNNGSRRALDALASASRSANPLLREAALNSMRRQNARDERRIVAASAGAPVDLRRFYPTWSREFEIINRRGLDARPAAKLVRVVSGFEAQVQFSKEADWLSVSVDSRSIMGLMMLAAGQGSTLSAVAIGRQAIEALDAVEALVNDRFEENE